MKPNRAKPIAYLTTALSLAVFSAGMGPALAADDMNLSGVVRDASGPLAGVSVSARAKDTTVTTSVFTDAKGAYYFPAMASGQYDVWAQAEGYNFNNSEASLNGAGHQDFSLTPAADIYPQMMGDEYLASLPQATADDKRMQHLFRNACTGCHPANFPLQHRFDEAGWTAILDQMKSFAGRGKTYDIIDFHEKEFAAYLAHARGPGPTTMKLVLHPRPTGDAARVVYRSYDVPVDRTVQVSNRYATNNGSNWQMGAPSELFGTGGIHDVELDFDGNIWFANNMASRFGTIGRVDATTGAVTFYKVDGANDYAASSHGMVRDHNGDIYFNASVSRGHSYLARVNPKTRDIKVFKPVNGDLGPGGTLDIDGKGFVWAETAAGAVRFDPKTETFTEYKSEFQPAQTYAPIGDRDGNGWALLVDHDIVSHFDVKTGKVTDIKMAPNTAWDSVLNPAEKAFYATNPLHNNDVTFPWSQGPRRGDADLNGNVVWVSDWWGGNLARIDIHSLEVNYVPLPNPDTQLTYFNKVDSHHNVWVGTKDEVLKYDPSSKQWTTYDFPVRGPGVRYFSLMERDGKMSVVIPFILNRSVATMNFRSEHDMQALETASMHTKQASLK